MKLMNVYPSIYVVTAPSGKTYRAEIGQTIIPETQADADYMLAITRRMGCCGTPERVVSVFQIIDNSPIVEMRVIKRISNKTDRESERG